MPELRLRDRILHATAGWHTWRVRRMSPFACLRCERPVLDPFNLCESCVQREIDARGRYKR